MAGTWRRRAIGVVAAVVAAFGLLAVFDALPGEDPEGVLAGSGSSTADGGDQQDRLEATGTTIESAAAPDEAAGSGGAGEPASQAATATGAVETGTTGQFESIRNDQAKFSRFADVPSARLDLAALTEPAPVNDNGGSTAGQFRVACEYSHFGYDDPIVFPGQPGRSHLHMFFGNTLTDAFTTQEKLVDTGGGTCSGFELNRSAYWTPALLDGSGNTVVPDSIIIYYKTKYPDAVTAMPQGLQMVAGNTTAESFEASGLLHWSCGPNGHAYDHTNRIPDCNGDVINASIQFPNCWDGVNLTSSDFVSHLTYANDQQACPTSHPKRLPQISILMYFPGTDSVDGWQLSSDQTDGFNGAPGGTLHADWWGGWNDETMNLWIDGCMKASRNCSFGQTGGPRQLAGLNPLEVYEGENYLPLPS